MSMLRPKELIQLAITSCHMTYHNIKIFWNIKMCDQPCTVSVAGVDSMNVTVPFSSMIYSTHTTAVLFKWGNAWIIRTSVSWPRPCLITFPPMLPILKEVPFICHSIVPLLQPLFGSWQKNVAFSPSACTTSESKYGEPGSMLENSW